MKQISSQCTFILNYKNVAFQAKKKVLYLRISVSKRRTFELSFSHLPESGMADIIVDKDSINGSLLFESREKHLFRPLPTVL